MAQRDGSSNSGLRPVRNLYGSIAIRSYVESTCASSKCIAVGDIVTFDTVVNSSGNPFVVIAPSSQGNAQNLLQNGITSLLGVAVSASTSDGSTTGQPASTALSDGRRNILVAIADGFTEFAIDISSVGATPQVPASSMIGRVYPIECVRSAVGQKAGHGVWFLSSTNESTAADLSFVVTDVPSDQIGTTGGFVYGKFLSTMVHRSVRAGGPIT